jgi:ProP effector
MTTPATQDTPLPVATDETVLADNSSDAIDAPPVAPLSNGAAAPSSDKQPSRFEAVQPVLEKLFELYPQLFGAQFLPLKLGIYHELLAAHPDAFEATSLKAAMGVHARSTRYLQGVAAGLPRHGLDGAAVEAVAPEHVYVTLLELFRRRERGYKGNHKGNLRPQFRVQLMQAFEASGLSRQDYQARVQTNEPEATALLEEAFAEREEWVAKQEALLRAYDASGASPEAFADMYGLKARDVQAALERRAT